MFTGLVLGLATVKSFEITNASAKLRLLCSQAELTNLRLGASVCVNGVCLSVVQQNSVEGEGVLLDFDLSAETLERSIFKSLKVEDKVHVEASLKMGDELGGHLVSGHVDGVAKLISKNTQGEYLSLDFLVEGLDFTKVSPFLIEKGSIAIDGVSLTVNSVKDELSNKKSIFNVMLIPETISKTRFANLAVGDVVNLEADMLAKYICKYQQVTKELQV